jgi:hypothetical protein
VHAAAEFGHRQARIGLQLGEDARVMGIDFSI